MKLLVDHVPMNSKPTVITFSRKKRALENTQDINMQRKMKRGNINVGMT